MKKKVLLLLLVLLVAGFAAAAAKAVTPLRPAPTPPDTDSVLILKGAFNVAGYWWDHTDLTVAVQAQPGADAESVAAVRQAIADWDFALRQEFGGLITLTDVTDQYTAKHKADIVIHYNPTAGGNVFGGMAVCGAHKCNNVIVRSELTPPVDFTYPPQYLYYVTMHELGHALGLGHAQPLTESTDLMGYGWHWSNGIVPTLSECDLAGIAVVFAWALQGVDPSPPTQASVACD
jgi:predicted Zn-dependent protease